MKTPVPEALVLECLRGRLSQEEAARRAGLSAEELREARQRYLETKLPPTRQTLRAGVRATVRIVRDAGWVPHIIAEEGAGSARDLFFGHGFAMAQDRLWQMDYLRRRALGRLAEVLGPEALASDRQHRILGIERMADQELPSLSDEAAVALDGFAAGINAWIEQAAAILPIEFEILEYQPEPWAPRDSLALLRAFYWQLTGRLENLAVAEAARRFLGDGLAADFLRTESPDETILSGPTPNSQPLAAAGGEGEGGSNNWVVAPARSASGHAMLATDPHLPFSLPAGWYQAHLSGAGYEVAGAGHPGAPGFWLGHNDRAAWGITNLVASPRDIYVETLHPDDPNRYRQDGGWAAFERRTEKIAVRGAAPVELEVRSTARGPIVDEIIPTLDEPIATEADGTVLSLSWVGQERLDDVHVMLDLNRARDWGGFRAALSRWRLPIFNMVYADADGHIGWQAVGSIPIRGDGDTSRGYRPANDPRHEWRGYIPFEDLPRLADPARGWIATANNRPTGDDFPQPLYGWWAPGHRAVRLRRLLDGRQQLTRDDFRRMQFDAYSVRAEQAVPRLREILLAGDDATARQAADLLDGWDYHYRPDSVAATIFETIFELWQARVIGSRFPAPAQPLLIGLGAGSGLALRLIAEGTPGDWFRESTIEAQLVETAADALAELEGRLGPDSARWRWGALHTVQFRHPLDGRPGTDGLFATPPREAHGTHHVLNNNGYSHDRRFDVTIGAEFRMVVDFADLDATETILTTGQSGQPGSAHYTEMTGKWVAGEYLRLPFSSGAVERSQVNEAWLHPIVEE